MKESTRYSLLSLVGVIVLGLLVAGGLIGCPKYNVWQQGLAGQANLRSGATGISRPITQAQAEKESATIRAEAIAIVGKAAQDFPEYRYQEFLGAFAEALQSEKVETIIYVPTEANVPIMEAGRTLAK